MPRTARDVVFVDGVRTPFGKAGPNGLYAETRADDMVVSVIRELVRRNPALPPERIGEVAIAATSRPRTWPPNSAWTPGCGWSTSLSPGWTRR